VDGCFEEGNETIGSLALVERLSACLAELSSAELPV
jgi:hypothetical protein